MPTPFVVSLSKPAFPPQASLQAILPTLLLICGETASAEGYFPPPRVVGKGAKPPAKVAVQALGSQGMPFKKKSSVSGSLISSTPAQRASLHASMLENMYLEVEAKSNPSYKFTMIRQMTYLKNRSQSAQGQQECQAPTIWCIPTLSHERNWDSPEKQLAQEER